MKNTYEHLQPIVSKGMHFFFHPTIEYLDEIPLKTRMILAGNHSSNFDPFLLSMVTKRQIHFLAKKELFDSPLKGVMTSIESIPVNRNGNDVECVKTALSYLKEEKCLGIFPEGTINKTNDLILPFKLGVVLLAKRSKADIFPFAITGGYHLVRNHLKIVIGKRIKPEKYTSHELLEKLESDVKTLLLRK